MYELAKEEEELPDPNCANGCIYRKIEETPGSGATDDPADEFCFKVDKANAASNKCVRETNKQQTSTIRPKTESSIVTLADTVGSTEISKDTKATSNLVSTEISLAEENFFGKTTKDTLKISTLTTAAETATATEAATATSTAKIDATPTDASSTFVASAAYSLTTSTLTNAFTATATATTTTTTKIVAMTTNHVSTKNAPGNAAELAAATSNAETERTPVAYAFTSTPTTAYVLTGTSSSKATSLHDASLHNTLTTESAALATNNNSATTLTAETTSIDLLLLNSNSALLASYLAEMARAEAAIRKSKANNAAASLAYSTLANLSNVVATLEETRGDQAREATASKTSFNLSKPASCSEFSSSLEEVTTYLTTSAPDYEPGKALALLNILQTLTAEDFTCTSPEVAALLEQINAAQMTCQAAMETETTNIDLETSNYKKAYFGVKNSHLANLEETTGDHENTVFDATTTSTTTAPSFHWFNPGLRPVALRVGLSPLQIADTGLMALSLSVSGSAPLQLDSNTGVSPRGLKGVGQATLALVQPGEEEKTLTGHGYMANPLESNGKKPILVQMGKVKPKLLLTSRQPAVVILEMKRPQII